MLFSPETRIDLPPRERRDEPEPTRYGRLWWLGAVALALVAAALAALTLDLSLLGARGGPVSPPLWWLGGALAAAGLAMFAWRIVLAARYRPVPGAADDDLPVVTVIVPAYNEGRQVLLTLRSVLASDYPADKLTIVAVDDGSQDDTWHWIRAGAAESGGRVQAVRDPQNRGKRHALAQGFARSRGSVLVTVDSDSEIEPSTLRNLVTPIARDPRIGAVAGNVRVLARQRGAIARMLDVTFTYGFDFIRAGQSEVDMVLCTPGALSAYRRDVALRVLDEWIDQTFLGLPAKIGEDRAMTNLILREGYDVKFQGNAVVFTEVPTRLAPLSRMLLRWARSNLRESWVTLGFVFRRFRSHSATGGRLMFTYGLARLVSGIGAWLLAVGGLAVAPISTGAVLVGGALIGALAPAVVYALLRGGRGAAWALAYGVYALVALSWITPYALISLRRNGWLTRQLPASIVPLRPPTPLGAPQPAIPHRRDAGAA